MGGKKMKKTIAGISMMLAALLLFGALPASAATDSGPVKVLVMEEISLDSVSGENISGDLRITAFEHSGDGDTILVMEEISLDDVIGYLQEKGLGSLVPLVMEEISLDSLNSTGILVMEEISLDDVQEIWTYIDGTIVPDVMEEISLDSLPGAMQDFGAGEFVPDVMEEISLDSQQQPVPLVMEEISLD